MSTDIACQAIRKRVRLELRYDGAGRCVEVHAVGYTKAGHPIMRAWQVRGGSVRGELAGWKLMRLDEATSAHLIEEPSEAPRKGYKRGDTAMERILCEV